MERRLERGESNAGYSHRGKTDWQAQGEKTLEDIPDLVSSLGSVKWRQEGSIHSSAPPPPHSLCSSEAKRTAKPCKPQSNIRQRLVKKIREHWFTASQRRKNHRLTF